MTNIMQYQTVGTLYGVASLRHNRYLSVLSLIQVGQHVGYISLFLLRILLEG